MGFFSNIISATVKTVLTPVAIVTDVVKIPLGGKPDTTKELIESAVEDVGDGLSDLADGDL
mgnify:CR=1 FL=1